MLRLKLNHVSKRGPRHLKWFSIFLNASCCIVFHSFVLQLMRFLKMNSNGVGACLYFSQHLRPEVQYIPRNMHTVFALLCFVVVIHWLIFPYPSGLLHWHCGNLTIAPVPAKQPWWIWINTSCEFIMNDCITTTKQSTTKPCAYFLGYTVVVAHLHHGLCLNVLNIYLKSIATT